MNSYLLSGSSEYVDELKRCRFEISMARTGNPYEGVYKMTTFSGAMAVLPAAFVPMVQIPIMLLILKLAPRVGGFLGGATEVK